MGAGDAAGWPDFNIHPANIDPGHWRSQGGPRPSSQVPSEEAARLEGAVGSREWGQGRSPASPQTLTHGQGVPRFTGEHKGQRLALWYLHGGRGSRLAGARCPAHTTDPSACQSQYLRSGGKVSVREQAMGLASPPPGPSAATLLPEATRGSPGAPRRTGGGRSPFFGLCLCPQLHQGAPRAGGQWASVPEAPRHSCSVVTLRAPR